MEGDKALKVKRPRPLGAGKPSKFDPEILQYAVTHGVAAAAETFELNKTTIYRWAKERGVTIPHASEGRMTEALAFRIAVIEYARDHTAKEAAFHFGLPVKTLWKWQMDYRNLLRALQPLGPYLLRDGEMKKVD